MNIKILAALAISLLGFAASMARAEERLWHGHGGEGNRGGWSHDYRGYGGNWDHESHDGRRYGGSDRGRGGYDGYRHDEYRAPRWTYGYAPRYYAPGYYAPRYYSPSYYAPDYYAPRYYAPAYDPPVYYAPGSWGGWFDDLGVVIHLHLP
jgi:hypothetical protein